MFYSVPDNKGNFVECHQERISKKRERILHLNYCALQTRTLKDLMGWRRFRRGQGRVQGSQ